MGGTGRRRKRRACLVDSRRRRTRITKNIKNIKKTKNPRPISILRDKESKLLPNNWFKWQVHLQNWNMMTKGSFRPNRKTNTNIQSKIDEAKLNMHIMFGLLLIAFIQNLYTSTANYLVGKPVDSFTNVHFYKSNRCLHLYLQHLYIDQDLMYPICDRWHSGWLIYRVILVWTIYKCSDFYWCFGRTHEA